MAEEKNSFYSDPQKLQFQSLVYPDDLDANNFYPDCVCFTIKKRTGVSVDDVTTAIGDGAEAYKRAWIGLGNEESTPKHIKQLMKKLDKEEPSEAARQKKLVAAVKDYKENILALMVCLKICLAYSVTPSKHLVKRWWHSENWQCKKIVKIY